MPNQYFQFKKFMVQQDKCSMKVCTDSCLFGAWVAHKTVRKLITPKRVLDIGTGTGLLSLMLAQKITAQIDAVDIDSKACMQARENFHASPWSEHLQVFNSGIQEWAAPGKYDLIISNPPFYENDLLPKDTGKNISKHSAVLSLNELLIIAGTLLSDNGNFAVLLPWHRAKGFESAALAGSFFITEKTEVRPTPRHDYFRTMLILQKHATIINQSRMSIKDNSNEYTQEFVDLLKDYYWHL
ncbi:MAG: methyltransferase [Ginsengibacter sp.]